MNALLALEQEQGEEEKPVKQEDDNGENGRVFKQLIKEDPALVMMEVDEPDPSTLKDALKKNLNTLLALEQEEGEEGKPVKQEDDNGENGRVLK